MTSKLYCRTEFVVFVSNAVVIFLFYVSWLQRSRVYRFESVVIFSFSLVVFFSILKFKILLTTK